MDQMKAIQEAVTLLLDKARQATVSELATAVETVSGALRLSTDLEKSQAELRKLALEESKLRQELDSEPTRQRLDRLKEYTSLLAPMVSVVTLAATLIVQSWQFRESEKDKRIAAEDATWAETIKAISQHSHLSPVAAALYPFFKSPKYGDLASRQAVSVLMNSSDPDLFESLFGLTFVPVNWNNLDQVLDLDRALFKRQSPLWALMWDPAKQDNDKSKLSKEEEAIYEYNRKALTTISSHVGALLKTPRPDGLVLNLSGARFQDSDWSGVDLSGANIEGTDLQYLDIKGARFANITYFERAGMSSVPWWEAGNMGSKLLEYLENNEHSKHQDVLYGTRGKSRKVSADQYKADLTRLKRQAQ